MIAAAAASSATPLVLLSAAVSFLTLVEIAIKGGKWIGSVELRLDRHQKDLQHLGRAETHHICCPDPAAHIPRPADAPAPAVLEPTDGGQ